jgi:hypothetical protein
MKQAVALAVVTVVLATAGGALAGGTFEDVPPSHTFAEEIEAIAGAGITTGFPDGTYRPSGTVSRGAMAAFMARGFSGIGVGENATPVSLVGGGSTAVTSVRVDAGATEAGNGYVLFNGTVTASTTGLAECPCTLEVGIIRAGDSSLFASTFSQLPGEAGTIGPQSDISISVTGAVALPADTSTEYFLQVGLNGVVDEAHVIELEGTLTAVYAPFASSSQSTPVDLDL